MMTFNDNSLASSPTNHLIVSANLAAFRPSETTPQDGVRVADVAWASGAFVAEHADATPFPAAPELCIEIVSPSNSKAAIANKVRLYFSQGAHEVWVVTLKRVVTVYIGGKPAERSGLVGRIDI